MRCAWALVLLCLALHGCKDKPSPAPDAAPTPAGSSALPIAPVNATPLPSASVAAVLGADRLPPYTGPTGSIEGTVFVTGDRAPDVQGDFSKCPEGAKTYDKLFREGSPDDSKGGARPLIDALVGVTGYSGYYVAEKNEAKLATIEQCAFTRRTIDLTFGQRLDIANKTPRMMYAPALSGVTTPALMVAPPTGEPIHLYPPKPGYFRLTDRLNPTSGPTADVYVLLHPLHTVTDLAGHFRLDGVPVGKVTVFTRLAPIGEIGKPVEILAGVVQKVDLTLVYARLDAGAGGAGTASDAAAKPVLH
jgi:hypothetical protein